ncbi:hypothetical protein [Saccharicrinis sp. GN24d3]|uniref:hypothetical protein n=1 Tax=Saccharicrinis sp. GN24d3 TaxID=3458416 RepID=UPI0040375047
MKNFFNGNIVYLINRRLCICQFTGIKVFVFLFMFSGWLFSQNTNPQKEKLNPLLWQEFEGDRYFKPFVILEAWVTYSMNERTVENQYADRVDISLRRIRFGGIGSPYPWLRYCLQLSMDRLGEDSFASTKGSYQGLDVWNAFVTAKLSKKSDLLNLHLGYFWPQISREYSTVAWSQGSFDRTRANWYLRRFMTGKGNGIETGIALGGLKNYNGFGFSYRIGTFEPKAYSGFEYSSRLYTGHVLFTFGQPEQNAYKYRLSGNSWRSRKGVSLGVGASSQTNGALNDSVYFDSSNSFGTDILVSYTGFRLDAEYFRFYRSASGFDDFNGTEWHVRLGYSFVAGNKYFEPVITYDKFEGWGAKSVYKYIGDDYTVDVGVNWYLNKEKLKLSAHYLVQSGSVSPNTGDYFGLGCQLKL